MRARTMRDPSARRIPSVRRVSARSDVASYVTAPFSKAAAYHPLGKLFVITGAANQHAAEEQALAAATTIRRATAATARFLYASNNEVLIGRRAKTPITPASAASQPPASPLKVAP